MREWLQRIGIGALVAAAAVVAIVGGAAGPAGAAEPDMLVSDDGILFTPVLGGPLFRQAAALVPLESERASLWVRNSGGAAAELRISVAEIATSSFEMASSVTFATTDEARGTRVETDLSQLHRCDVLVPSQRIAAGSTVRIDFDVAMLDVDGLTAQDEVGSLSLRAAMRDASAGPLPATVCDSTGVEVPVWQETTPPGAQPAGSTPSGAQRLGTTGAASTPLALGAGALLAFGFLLVAARRRRREDERP